MQALWSNQKLDFFDLRGVITKTIKSDVVLVEDFKFENGLMKFQLVDEIYVNR